MSLTRRTPMKRTPMRRQSAKCAKRRKSQGQLKAELMLHRGLYCQHPAPGCTRFATDLSHRLPVSAGGPDTPENVRLLCRNCHGFYHRNPKLAYTTGVFLTREQAVREGIVKEEGGME